MEPNTCPTMNHKELLAETVAAIEAKADTARQEAAKWYYPTSMRVIGAKNPDLTPVISGLVKKFRGYPPEEAVAFAKMLTGTDIFECQVTAFTMLTKLKKPLAVLTLQDLNELGRTLDNWASVDAFSCYVAGIVWRLGNISDEVVRGWAVSDNRWIRRSAVVCTVALNQKSRGGTGDPRRTLEICEIAAADHDDMVVKAVSWALRELSKREPELIRDFLAKHESVLHKKVLREVRNKLETGRKLG